MDDAEKRAKHAAYMREYNERPGKRMEKRQRDRASYTGETADRIREQSRQYYHDHKETRLAYIKRRECLLKRKAVAYLGGKCQRCGFDHPGALQFHHRIPADKLFTVTVKQMSSPKQFPWEMIQAELDKCDLLCANCHFLHHNTWRDEWLQEILT